MYWNTYITKENKAPYSTIPAPTEKGGRNQPGDYLLCLRLSSGKEKVKVCQFDWKNRHIIDTCRLKIGFLKLEIMGNNLFLNICESSTLEANLRVKRGGTRRSQREKNKVLFSINVHSTFAVRREERSERSGTTSEGKEKGIQLLLFNEFLSKFFFS